MNWDNVATITKSELHKADIILVDGPSGFAVAIEWGIWSPVSHAALCLGYDEVAESLDKGPTLSSKPNCGP